MFMGIFIEGVQEIRPKVTLDVMSNSPFVSQANISNMELGKSSS